MEAQGLYGGRGLKGFAAFELDRSNGRQETWNGGYENEGPRYKSDAFFSHREGPQLNSHNLPTHPAFLGALGLFFQFLASTIAWRLSSRSLSFEEQSARSCSNASTGGPGSLMRLLPEKSQD